VPWSINNRANKAREGRAFVAQFQGGLSDSKDGGLWSAVGSSGGRAQRIGGEKKKVKGECDNGIGGVIGCSRPNKKQSPVQQERGERQLGNEKVTIAR
jgi:hypothetical protein